MMSEFISRIHWRPMIGDPSFMGWLTVAAYALAAVLCLLAAQRVPLDDDLRPNRPRRHMWLGVGLFMSFLCLNKQLDLQTLLTRIGRELATQGGWYGQRQIVQLFFVIAVATAGIAAFIIIRRKTRSVLRESRLLLFGLSFLISFIIIRASSFHHVGEFLGREIIGIRMNWMLELGGIGLVAVSAAQAIRRPRVG
jgi:hypothetical protein